MSPRIHKEYCLENKFFLVVCRQWELFSWCTSLWYFKCYNVNVRVFLSYINQEILTRCVLSSVLFFGYFGIKGSLCLFFIPVTVSDSFHWYDDIFHGKKFPPEIVDTFCGKKFPKEMAVWIGSKWREGNLASYRSRSNYVWKISVQ